MTPGTNDCCVCVARQHWTGQSQHLVCTRLAVWTFELVLTHYTGMRYLVRGRYLSHRQSLVWRNFTGYLVAQQCHNASSANARYLVSYTRYRTPCIEHHISRIALNANGITARRIPSTRHPTYDTILGHRIYNDKKIQDCGKKYFSWVGAQSADRVQLTGYRHAAELEPRCQWVQLLP